MRPGVNVRWLSQIFLVAVALFSSRCVNSYYVPSSHNVPLLTEKKDGRASLSYYNANRDFINVIPGVELQGSYAVGDHVGLMGSFLSAGKTVDMSSFSTQYADLGIGCFTTAASQKLVFELYGAFGLGHARNGFDANITSDAHYTKVYVQPVIGFKSTYFDAAISWRLASVHFTSVNPMGPIPSYGLSDLDWIINQPTGTVSEPAFTLRAGTGLLKLQIQTGLSINYTRPETYNFGSVGLFLTLPAKGLSDP